MSSNESVSPPIAFLIARSILSLGMDSARAVAMASLRRALAVGSGMPCLAASVMSRDSLEKILERFLSWAPLRNWMFLNFECPDMALRVLALWSGRRKRPAIDAFDHAAMQAMEGVLGRLQKTDVFDPEPGIEA